MKEDERAGMTDKCPVLINFMTECAALHYRALGGGTTKHFQSEPETRFSVTQTPVDTDCNICDLWLSTRHLLLYQEQTRFPNRSQCHAWLDWVTLTFVCQLVIKPTISGQNEPQITATFMIAVICKNANTHFTVFLHVFIMFKLFYNSSIYLYIFIYIYLHLHCTWKHEKPTS